MSEFQSSRFKRLVQLIKFSGFLNVFIFVINFFALLIALVTQEVVVCIKKCSAPVGLYDHPVWFFILMFIHIFILFLGLLPLWKALK